MLLHSISGRLQEDNGRRLMAVSEVDQKILGRLGKQTAPSNPLLSASLYQVLGLCVLLSRKLFRARKLRKLDPSRDTKSLSLYHHIIWLSREGLSITEVYVLPYCQDGEQGPECRVMAAKLRASFYHIFCLFHNHPPVNQLSARSTESPTSTSGPLTPRTNNNQTRRSPGKNTRDDSGGISRAKKSALRDAIPSMTSETSYVTNPYATGAAQTPPPAHPPPPLPPEARRTPTRPPGLTPINIPPAAASASFILPPLNFVPMATEHFQTAQQLANTLLSASHALRLSVSLEHSAYLWDCAKELEKARRLARRAIKDLYESTDGLDDEEFQTASALAQALGGIVKRGTNDSTPKPSIDQLTNPARQATRPPPPQSSARTSPNKRARAGESSDERSVPVSPTRSAKTTDVARSGSNAGPSSRTTLSPPVSRLSSRSRQRRTSSTASDKATKRRMAEQAEEVYRRNSASNRSNVSSAGSRQATPPESYKRTGAG